jgi:hypothetical protein
MFNETMYHELARQWHGGQWSALPSLASEIVECFALAKTAKELRALERFYALVGPAVTVESVENHREFWHRTATNADGSPVRCRSKFKVKRWKKLPNEFQLPVKYGLRECFYITPHNAHEWTPAP